MDRICQVGLRQSHLTLIVNALEDSMNAEDFPDDDDTVAAWNDLRYFMERVLDNPGAFPPTGQLARSIKKGVAQVKGTSNTPSRKNKRKERQMKRQGWNKARRRMRAKNAAAYNEAVATYEAEKIEMDKAYEEQQAVLDAQPKFDVFTVTGERIISGVPESMIRPVEKDVDSIAEDAASEIILP